ncbi:MAG TPA: hypothetical protein VGE07_10110 [Herpetosiphonaceae bacterium]
MAIDVAGQTVAVWCEIGAERKRIAHILAPLGLRVVAVSGLDEIDAARPACVLFYTPWDRQPAFAQAWDAQRALRSFPAIRLIPRTSAWMPSTWIAIDDIMTIPYEAEELIMRVRRRIELWLARQHGPPADG